MFLTAFCFALAVEAQTPATLTGRVIDASTRQPVASAQIVIAAASRMAVSAENGTFELRGLPAGTHLVAVRRIGYEPRQDTVQLRAGETRRIDIALALRPVPLPEVAVEAERGYLGGFWERRRLGPGYYFTRDDIAVKKPHRIIDLIRNVPGAHVVALDNQGLGAAITFSRSRTRTFSPSQCIPALFVNGVPMLLPPLGLNEFPPDDVEAIEMYSGPARLPAQFNMTGGDISRGSPVCGVVAIWLRGQP